MTPADVARLRKELTEADARAADLRRQLYAADPEAVCAWLESEKWVPDGRGPGWRYFARSDAAKMIVEVHVPMVPDARDFTRRMAEFWYDWEELAGSHEHPNHDPHSDAHGPGPDDPAPPRP
jgi:hypothetical protein